MPLTQNNNAINKNEKINMTSQPYKWMKIKMMKFDQLLCIPHDLEICHNRQQPLRSEKNQAFMFNEISAMYTKQCHLSCMVLTLGFINSLRPRDAYRHQKTRPSLVQIMACHLFSTTPLSEPNYAFNCIIGNKISWKCQSTYLTFIKENNLKMSPVKLRPCCCGLSLLISAIQGLHCSLAIFVCVAKSFI